MKIGNLAITYCIKTCDSSWENEGYKSKYSWMSLIFLFFIFIIIIFWGGAEILATFPKVILIVLPHTTQKQQRVVTGVHSACEYIRFHTFVMHIKVVLTTSSGTYHSEDGDLKLASVVREQCSDNDGV